jgi:transposase
MLTFPSLTALDQSLRVGIYLCTTPTDMRKGFDTLAALVRDHLGRDPLSGDVFLFLSRGKDRLKALAWESDGFSLWYKRLEEGTYRLPPHEPGTTGVTLKASALAMLLDGIDLQSVRKSPRYRRQAVGAQTLTAKPP